MNCTAKRKRIERFAAAANAIERISELDSDMNRIRIRVADRQEEIAELSESLRDTRLDIAAVETAYQEQRDLLKEIDRTIESHGGRPCAAESGDAAAFTANRESV